MNDRTFLVASGVWEIAAHDEIDACVKFLDLLEQDLNQIDVVEVIEEDEDGVPDERSELPESGDERESDDGTVIQFGPVSEDVLNKPDTEDDL